VTDHGGSIEPQSAGKGRGARMRVLLPLGESKVQSPGSKVESQDFEMATQRRAA
jgi:hypothetical protein